MQNCSGRRGGGKPREISSRRERNPRQEVGRHVNRCLTDAEDQHPRPAQSEIMMGLRSF